MYVREKKIRRGEGTWDSPLKVYSYWQLVEGRRVDGKVRQTVVHHIGPAKDRDHADRLARARGFLCGWFGCGEPATMELTWRGYSRNTPVEWHLEGKKYGALVCPGHLAEWHRWQLDRFRSEERSPVMPLLFPPERQRKPLL